MKIVDTEAGQTISVGPFVPAIVLVFEQEAEVRAFCCGFSHSEFERYVARLIDERGTEWGEAFLRVLDFEFEGASDV